MKQYEIMTIYSIDLSEEEAKKLSKTIQEVIASLKGKIVKSDYWGKRKFAYEIDRKSEGYYDVFNIELAENKMSDLKSKLNLTDGLVRYLITAQS